MLFISLGVTCLPFINQAFHIDDRIYLSTAEHILQAPLFPYDFPLYFEGILATDMASHSHLPFTSYYLALVKGLTGSEQEWVYHLSFLIFPVIAIFSFYDIARRYVLFPLGATLLFLVSPSFLVLSHTLMPDVPLLAAWLLALSRLLRITTGEEARHDRLILYSAVMCAAFMSLLTVGLLLLIGSYLLFRLWKSLPIHGRIYWVLLFLGPVLLWLIWYLRAYLHYDRMVLATVFLYVKNERVAFDWSELGLKFLSFLLNSGSVLLIPVVVWVAFSGRYRTWAASSLFVLCLVFFPFFVAGWRPVHIFLFCLFLASGFLVLWTLLDLIRDARPEKRMLFLWYFGILAACLFLYFNGSVRYVLLALPPVILVWIRCLERKFKERYLIRNLLGAVVAFTVFVSGPIAYADYRFADIYRTISAELYSKYKSEDSTIWFAGEWGFRYYMEKQGAKLLPRTSRKPQPGDIIIKPYVAFPWVTLFDGDPKTSLLEQRVVEEPFPVRILDFSSHAGFYSTGWGVLPVSISAGDPWEWFNVYRVEMMFEGPVPEERQWW